MTDIRSTRIAPVLATLMLGTFTAGCAEQLVVGLLPRLSAGLDISLSTAATLVSSNAAGLALGGPLLAALTVRADRRRILLVSLVVFAALLVVPVVTDRYAVFVVARLLGGAFQGLFMAAAFATASAVARPGRAGSALAVVIAGFSLATVVGLPLGVMIGAAIGWRGAFLTVVLLALLTLVLLGAVAPPVPTPADRDGALRNALSRRVGVVLALGLLLFGGVAAVSTYLMPLLRHAGVTGTGTGPTLFLYGLVSVAGAFLGGRMADRDAARGLLLAAISLCGCFAGLLLTTAGVVPLLLVLGIGLVCGAAPPSLQYRVVDLAGPAGAVAAALPASAANAGIALGAAMSGLAYARGSITGSVLTGLVIAAAAAGLAYASRGLRYPAHTAPAHTASPLARMEPTPRSSPAADRAALPGTRVSFRTPGDGVGADRAASPWRP